MKKLLAIFLVIVAVGILSGCGGESTDTSGPAPKTGSAAGEAIGEGAGGTGPTTEGNTKSTPVVDK